MSIRVVLATCLVIAACQQGDKNRLDPKAQVAAKPGGSASSSGAGAGSGAGGAASDGVDIDSKDILARPLAEKVVSVKHVLVSWKELAEVYRGHQDPRGAMRTNAEAATLAQQIADKLRANPASIDALAKELSEDPGSAQSGEPYEVKDESPFVPEFKKLALHLHPNEVGIVRTQFGYHVMTRVAPPPPDPVESSDILHREPKPGSSYVNHLLVGWKDNTHSPDAKASTRTKADADQIVKDVIAKANSGADFAKLIKDFSGEPDAKDAAQEPTQIEKETPILDQFKDLALRLNVGEAGAVKTQIGWLVMKRVDAPPADPLESADILARSPQTEQSKVKHILLGWKGHSKDPRGEKRDRATLDQLVKATVAKLKGGAKIEPLMAELSEDPGSAKGGTSYDVKADAQFVVPFKNLSLRLKVGEVGVVKTEFGIHIIQRIE
jgi:parvulin-like peptidyl-prolyl isomerase